MLASMLKKGNTYTLFIEMKLMRPFYGYKLIAWTFLRKRQIELSAT